MPHDHTHGKGHGHAHVHVDLGAEGGDRRVAIAIAVNVVLTIAQVVGGIASGSLALIADAIHNLSDAMALVIAIVARRIARRPADPGMTFGYGRAEPVAALVNYTSLILIALYLGYEALWRLLEPSAVDGWIVVWVAALALAVDAVTAGLVWRMAKSSMNMRAAFLHNLADALTSVAVIAGGALVLLYDWRLVDPLVTLGISGFILWHAAREVGPVIRLLMLGTPPGLVPQEVLDAMGRVPGVADVHHLHLWQIDEARIALEAHVVAGEGAEAGGLREPLRALLEARFGIRHVSLQIEAAGECGPAAPAIGAPPVTKKGSPPGTVTVV